ncbi:hypothetical protein CspeluHIS016_0209850 [Cutaneotrichosporon spelunceum]|uniref:Glycosyltransferase family 47 protein n=1 Tax=Cutaneotrichosporon spelunceum TaxID=1672016 RepID=A0AAD3YBM1_9TREE|nr:hypothetical protein CspeluHIS016_0209850 [Cutaneotrichosporon spelunceum]
MPPLFGLARRHRLVVAAILIVAALFVFTRSEPQPARPTYSRTPGVGLNDWGDAPLEEDIIPPPSNAGLKGWFRFSGLQSRGRTVLITGGAGMLAHALAPRLIDEGFIVHALDIVPQPATLPAGVVYHRGNVATSFRAVLESTPFDGVVHFASVSLDQWCAPKEDECTRVNVGGTKAVMDAIGDHFDNAHKSGKSMFGSGAKVPWILFGSSMDVFGPNATRAVTEDSPQEAESAIGRTKATAEVVVRDGFERARQVILRGGPENRDGKASFVKAKAKGNAMLHAAVVRFADVYGYRRSSSIPSAFFPRLLQNAVTSLPIQYSSDRPPMDLLHVEDAVDGVLRVVQVCDGIARLGKEAEPSLLTVNLVHGGKRWAEQEIVDLVRSATRSFSPVRDIGDNKGNDRGTAEFSSNTALESLGWTPTITLPIGLAKTVMHLAQDSADYAQHFLIGHCPKDSIVQDLGVDGPLRMLPEDSRNTELWKLDKCTVNMAFDNGRGFLHHVKCEDGKHCDANGAKVPSFNWNATVWIIEEVPGQTHTGNGKIIARLREEKGMGYLGIPEKELDVGVIHFELYPKGDKTPHHNMFEIAVAHDSSFLSMSIPKYQMQVWTKSTANEQQSAFELIPTRDSSAYNMRLTVLCCPSEGDWPLLLDDHESADSRFGTTNQIPSNSSRRTHLCERAHDAHIYYTDVAERSKKATRTTGPPKSQRKPQALARQPDDWALKLMPACWNDCAAPTVCIQTGKCRCVQADSCPRRRENPLTAIARGPRNPITPNKSHLGMYKGYASVLQDMVAKVDWRDLLYPEARAYLAAHPEFIKVHVAGGYPREQEIESADCHRLQASHCFSADSILYKAMRHLSVPAEKADLIVLPVYQHCTGAPFILHDVWGHAANSIKGINDGSKATSVVMTHDWGICLAFEWEIWSSRPHTKMYPDPLLRNTLVFSVMGDWDSNCYRPAQDVVVPARTCRSKNLVDTFPNVEHIMPARERPRLITWSGTFWGTGKSERLRITCNRGGVVDEELLKGQGPQSKFPREWDDYMVELNTARFCPQPRGVAGWSPRVSDALYAGCIPVLIAEATHYPFASMIDWSQISVRIHPTELDQVERILNDIPLERVEQLQANIVAIRDAFLYSTDDAPEDELGRRGPMFFALHEAGMRLRTLYARA